MSQTDELESALERLDVSWDPARARRVLGGVRKRRHDRKKALAATGVMLLVAAVGAVSLRHGEPRIEAGVLATSDGSRAAVLEPGTKQELVADRAELVELELESGAAEYRVTKHPTRRYRVRAGSVVVEVLGTVFDVARRADGTRVTVKEGRVHVSAPGGEAILTAGDDRVFTTSAPVNAVEPSPPSDAGSPGVVESHTPQTVESLLRAADRARVNGEPRVAARLLRRALTMRAEPDSGALVAFTLGRVLLEELHEPAPAAEAFVRAQTLDPEGPLAEDAAAREVEAWSVAGRTDHAHESALRYLEQHPHGRRAADVRQLGQVE